MQLREVYTGSVQERNAVLDENRKLKELLRLHGIAFPHGGGGGSSPGGQTNGRSSSRAVTAGGSALSHSDHSSPLQFHSHATTPTAFGAAGADPSFAAMYSTSEEDYDQMGVDFVLASVPQSSRRGG